MAYGIWHMARAIPLEWSGEQELPNWKLREIYERLDSFIQVQNRTSPETVSLILRDLDHSILVRLLRGKRHIDTKVLGRYAVMNHGDALIIARAYYESRFGEIGTEKNGRIRRERPWFD